MGKPLGIGIAARPNGPHLFVTPIDRVADEIWDAVRSAICANMTPEQFKQEVADAWAHHLKDDAEAARKELLK